MKIFVLLALCLTLAAGSAAQTTAPPPAQTPPTPAAPSAGPAYQPKSQADKAHSESEFSALAYMRTAMTAEKLYYRKHNKYADSLSTLVGSGSFTRRMVNPNRGDYTVSYRARPAGAGYSLVLTPKQPDPDHRSFYVDQTGEFRVDDEGKPATEKSPLLK